MPKRMTGSIGFQEDVAALVEGHERQCMKSITRGAFDLNVWSEVNPRADLILQRLKGENGLAVMPPGGWPQEKIATFASWISEGTPKLRGQKYSNFFRAIDAQTEYYDVYGLIDGLENMRPNHDKFFGPELLQGPWIDYISISPVTPLLKKQKQAKWNQVVIAANNPNIKDGLLKIDEWLCSLVTSHFSSNGKVDTESLFDAFMNFGADTLPPDEDRAQRVVRLGDPNDPRIVDNLAQYHRMDSRDMWFFWFGHIQCVSAALGGTTTDWDNVRDALLAGIFVGQTTDTAYRDGSNRKTRSAYSGAEGKQNILASAKILSTDRASAIEEMEELFLMYSGKIPAQ